MSSGFGPSPPGPIRPHPGRRPMRPPIILPRRPAHHAAPGPPGRRHRRRRAGAPGARSAGACRIAARRHSSRRPVRSPWPAFRLCSTFPDPPLTLGVSAGVSASGAGRRRSRRCRSLFGAGGRSPARPSAPRPGPRPRAPPPHRRQRRAHFRSRPDRPMLASGTSLPPQPVTKKHAPAIPRRANQVVQGFMGPRSFPISPSRHRRRSTVWTRDRPCPMPSSLDHIHDYDLRERPLEEGQRQNRSRPPVHSRHNAIQ